MDIIYESANKLIFVPFNSIIFSHIYYRMCVTKSFLVPSVKKIEAK